MIRPFFKGKRAFTLIESLVAVAILTLAIGGPFLAAARAYIAALDSNNRFMASNLAQEGIEYVRMLRDTTYLDDYRQHKTKLSTTAFYDDFIDGLSGSSGAGTSIYGCEGNPHDYGPPETGTQGGDGSVACALDMNKSAGVGANYALQKCTTLTSCPSLSFFDGKLQIIANQGTPTLFTRTLRFYNWGEVVKVVSTVTWTYHRVPFSLSVTDYLSPWQ